MENPRGFYTDEYRKILRDRLARIQCPILIIQGAEDRQDIPINKFNAQILIPELRALKKAVEVITYPGEVHCFCFYGVGFSANGRGTPHPAAVRKAFRDCEAFFRQHVIARPKPLESASVKYEPA